MVQTNVTRTVSRQDLGNTTVRQEQVEAVDTVDTHEYTLVKAAKVLWYFAHFIAIVLGLRFIFLLLGANMTGIVRFIYDLSTLFVLPFRGIFSSPRTGEFFFDTASLVAIAMYYLLVFLIVKALELFSKDTDTNLG